MRFRSVVRPTVLLLAAALACRPGSAAHADTPRAARIALVPLDDRPACLGDVLRVARLADAEVVTPAAALLGRFTRPGDGEGVARWLDALDLATLDAVVVSTDMLAYGGLVASRLPRVSQDEARRRLDAITRLKARRPDLPVYAFTTIMRLAPTADGTNDAWRDKVTRWAQVLPDAGNPDAAREVKALEEEIPPFVLTRYRDARERNRAINLAVIAQAARHQIDFLLVAQDDARPAGLHVSDRDAVTAALAAAPLDDARAVVQAGADEAAMLLVARALSAKFRYSPAFNAIFSSPSVAGAVLPFEDRPLREAVAGKVAAAGGTLSPSRGRTALNLYVYASRNETPDPAGAFAGRVSKTIQDGGRAVVADIDPGGDVQGASLPFVEALRAGHALPRLFGYASWNTAGNTLGLAVAHGLILAVGMDRVSPRRPDASRRIAVAQLQYLFYRLVNDFLYQGVVRQQARDEFLIPRRMNPLRLDDGQRSRVEKYLQDEVRPLAESLSGDFANGAWALPGLSTRVAGFRVGELSGFTVTLPWSRLFEAEIEFALPATPTTTPRR